MKSLSRVTALSLAALLAGSVLVGCSDDDKDRAKNDAAAAGVLACRIFQIGGGAGGAGLVEDLRFVLAAGSYEPAPLVAQISALRAGAGEAGRTVDLADADFKLFRAVAAAASDVQSAVSGSGARSLESEDVNTLASSLGAVADRCG